MRRIDTIHAIIPKQPQPRLRVITFGIILPRTHLRIIAPKGFQLPILHRMVHIPHCLRQALGDPVISVRDAVVAGGALKAVDVVRPGGVARAELAHCVGEEVEVLSPQRGGG